VSTIECCADATWTTHFQRRHDIRECTLGNAYVTNSTVLPLAEYVHPKQGLTMVSWQVRGFCHRMKTGNNVLQQHPLSQLQPWAEEGRQCKTPNWPDTFKMSSSVVVKWSCLQCFDTVGWASERASGLQKNEWWGAGSGMVICLKQSANDLHIVKLMPLPPHHLLLH